MASMRDASGVWLSLRSMMLVSAKLKPPISASQSARLSGTGHWAPGVLSTITTPVSASARRSTEPPVGFSPSSGQASKTTQAGIR